MNLSMENGHFKMAARWSCLVRQRDLIPLSFAVSLISIAIFLFQNDADFAETVLQVPKMMTTAYGFHILLVDKVSR